MPVPSTALHAPLGIGVIANWVRGDNIAVLRVHDSHDFAAAAKELPACCSFEYTINILAIKK